MSNDASDSSTIRKRSTAKRVGRRRWFVLLAAIIANYVPLINTHKKQDECSFGPVTNEDYLGYLKRAKDRLTISFYVDRRPLAIKLDELFSSISRSDDNVFMRLAAMHATLRALGAEYRNTNGNNVDEGRSDPYDYSSKSLVSISFNYLLDINRLWIFWPWPRDAWIVGSLAGPRDRRPLVPLFPKSQGEIRFIVNGPSPIEHPLGPPEIKANGLCPPIPALSLADKFEKDEN